MKKCFLTGLALLLPFALTLIIIIFLLNLVTHPFIGLAKGPLSQIISPHFVHLASQILIICVLFLIIFSIGFIGRIYMSDYLIHLGERITRHVPIVGKIYKPIQEVVHTLFASDKQKFSKVVLVPFPHSKVYCIGMVTEESDPENISVFIPSTPNPTVGYMLIFHNKELIYTSMKPDDAFKYVISCGVASGS